MTPSSTLVSVPLFSALRESEISLLAGLLTQRQYPRNRVVRYSYDTSDALYIVLKGQVKVILVGEDGRTVVLSLHGAGDFFGESALMYDDVPAATAVTTEDSTLLVLHRDALRRCLTEIPAMAFGLMRGLCERLRESDKKIGGLMLLGVPGRICRLLLDFAARNDGETIHDLPTHHIMAQMVGSSRETVSRAIGALVAGGLIEVENHRIRITDREALEAEAGQSLGQHSALRAGLRAAPRPRA